MSAQTVVFYETCGADTATTPGTNRPKVDEYQYYDNIVTATFSRTTSLDGFADLRHTSTMNNHVWFPANKNTDLIISGIPTAGYTDLKLTFDVATNASNANCTNGSADVNKVILEVNGAGVEVPSGLFEGQNKWVTSAEIVIPDGATTNLRFYYTTENNPTNFGYRFDNIKIVGTTDVSAKPQIETPSIDIFANNGTVTINAVDVIRSVEVYDITGRMLLNASSNVFSTDYRGVAFVRVITDNNTYMSKIIVK
ncbi:hypothetical protein FACS1894178_3900 [Bacteroidia bacterium]|nr:hypothetical protein FACS1894178_3900 [Bacteroidia bacterium]